MIELDVIERAIEVAAKAHQSQYRKGTNIPYITHPYAVGMMLLKNGCSEEVVAAGVLHDTLEDTPLTFEDIRNVFGEKIAELVKECSEPNKDFSWEERKQLTIKHLETAPKDVCLIACADKLHNIRSIRYELESIGEKIWERFKRGKEKQEWYYREIVDRLAITLEGEQIFNELKEEVEKVFS